NLRAFGGCGSIQALLLSLLEQIVCRLLSDLLRLLLFEDRLDLVFHFVERLHVSILPIVHTNDVKTIAALHQIADLPLGQRESGLLKLRNRATLADPSQRPAFLRTARIFGILFGQVLKLCSRLDLLEDIFCALLGLRHALLIHFPVRSWQRRLNQNVTDLRLLGHTILIAVLVVINLQVVVRDLYPILDFGEVDHGVLHLALLRNRICVIFLVAVVESFQLLRRGMKALLDIVLLQNGILKLYLGILFVELLP